MRNNFEKFLFLMAVLVVVFVSAASHPTFFVSGSQTAGAAATSSLDNQPPMIILPSLAADISAQTPDAMAVTSSIVTPAAVPGTPFARVADTTPPDLGIAAASVADLDTGASFLSVNADERWPMASISKLMTAVVATDLLDPDATVTITSSMTAADPTEHILNVGDTYTVEDLLHIMLLPSNNVAAESLAQFYGRSAFLAAMNAKAQNWGMTNTYYDDPSGLSAANESTANDLLKLAQNIYTQYPQILAITRMPEATAYNSATGQSIRVKSINDFAGEADFIGGKTGYTDQANGNLLSLFSYEGRPIFIVVLGIDDGVRFDGTTALYNWFKANFK